MAQQKMIITEMREILSLVKFQDYSFYVNSEYDDDKIYLQAEYIEDDVISKVPKVQKTRKWLISPFATRSEVVQTAFKCVLTSAEHRVREHFTYKGRRVYSPHYDVEALVELCDNEAFDEREDWYAEKD